MSALPLRVAGLAAVVALALIAASCAGDSGPTAPEVTPPVTPPAPVFAALGSTVLSTVSAGLTVVIVVDAPANVRLRVAMRPIDGDLTDTLIATVIGDRFGDTLATIVSPGSQTTMFENFGFTPARVEGEPFIIRVRGKSASTVARFHLIVEAPSQWPEFLPTNIAYGDTLFGEHLDSPSDIDRFAINVIAGDQYILFVRLAQSQTGGTIGLWRPGDLSAQSFSSTVGDFEERSVWSASTVTETRFLEVRSGMAYRGAYDVWLHRVDPLPESGPTLRTIGDTITEAIEVVSDIDEFRYDVKAGDEYVINVAAATAITDGLQMAFTYEVGETWLSFPGAHATLDQAGTGRIVALKDSTHVVRIRGPRNVSRANGITPYRLELARVQRAPEHVSPLLMLGDSLTGERIDRPADVDSFAVQLTEGAPVQFGIRTDNIPEGDQLCLVFSVGGVGRESACLNPGGNFTGGEWTPTYIPTVSGLGSLVVTARRLANTPYVLHLRAIDTAPEFIGSVLPFDSWVTGETLDPSGDIDRFTFLADPTRSYAFELGSAAGSSGSYRVNTSIPGINGIREERYIGSFTVDTATTVNVSVYAVFTEAGLAGNRRYDLRLITSSVAPETADSILSYGDTVSNESLDVMGDVDTYFFDAAEGDSVTLLVDHLQVPGTAKTVSVTLVDPEGITMFDRVRILAPGIQDFSLYGRTKAGRYRVRIGTGAEGREEIDVGPYALILKKWD